MTTWGTIHIFDTTYPGASESVHSIMLCGHVWGGNESKLVSLERQQGVDSYQATPVGWAYIGDLNNKEPYIKKVLKRFGCPECMRILPMREIVRAMDPEDT